AEAGLAVIGLILGGLLCLALVLGMISLPWVWREQHKAASRVMELLQSMGTVYEELNSNGLVRVRHFRDRVSKAADKSVIWPSSLFVLLDDVEARDGRF